ncbi:hypothetical protein Ctob_014836 [Chrysochromulina tobinii]|uniref:Uncharacterized protein n=1 Tax=Chrysochromulina tobinii TaxID=1460289 RepID=A0A0M0LT05_9EUKA|nr:hypothetical protein Ctob_014836 [Chrysochromulina tobinii]|eukprot:KOO53883.1 hypothetical protein Ctob_014836 [Chrysochromulina sp. CCMP291]
MISLVTSLLLGAPVDNVIKTIKLSLQQDELYGQPAPVPRARPQVLVIVSDHGSGTTEFGNALNTHPCMFDVGEPFSNADGPWSSTFHIAECEGSVETRNAIFDAQTGDSPSLYQGLAYDKGVADYFVRLRDLVCKHIPEDMCPPSDCTITLKMFPQFVDAVTPGFRDKEDHESPCTTKRNEFGLPAWKKELASFEQNPKIATFTLNRNERDRQFSIFHRFSPPGSEFDCSMARAPYIFETVAKSLSDGQMMIESCWKDAAGAAKCLADALKLVGLKPEPMGDRGVYELISSQHLSDTKSATQNCKTDPHAIFKSLANNDVKQLLDDDPGFDRAVFGQALADFLHTPAGNIEQLPPPPSPLVASPQWSTPMIEVDTGMLAREDEDEDEGVDTLLARTVSVRLVTASPAAGFPVTALRAVLSARAGVSAKRVTVHARTLDAVGHPGALDLTSADLDAPPSAGAAGSADVHGLVAYISVRCRDAEQAATVAYKLRRVPIAALATALGLEQAHLESPIVHQTAMPPDEWTLATVTVKLPLATVSRLASSAVTSADAAVAHDDDEEATMSAEMSAEERAERRLAAAARALAGAVAGAGVVAGAVGTKGGAPATAPAPRMGVLLSCNFTVARPAQGVNVKTFVSRLAKVLNTAEASLEAEADEKNAPHAGATLVRVAALLPERRTEHPISVQAAVDAALSRLSAPLARLGADLNVTMLAAPTFATALVALDAPNTALGLERPGEGRRSVFPKALLSEATLLLANVSVRGDLGSLDIPGFRQRFSGLIGIEPAALEVLGAFPHRAMISREQRAAVVRSQHAAHAAAAALLPEGLPAELRLSATVPRVSATLVANALKSETQALSAALGVEVLRPVAFVMGEHQQSPDLDELSSIYKATN